jgi:hypothetical protein
MTAPEIVYLGRRVPTHVSIREAGELIGKGKSYSHRHADTEGWPVIGRKPSRVVLVGPFLTMQGLPWEYVTDDAHEATRVPQTPAECASAPEVPS